jgi:ubiquinone/menaquinone biosynthesis C-methylase UbiE
MTEGWRGWDVYAPFYDWENARTLQRRDVAFWQRLAVAQDGPVLELGCGTGRIAVPVARAGARIVGIDRSQEMLARARKRIVRARLRGRLSLVRGDIRELPFTSRTKFSAVLAAYGILPSREFFDGAACLPLMLFPTCQSGTSTVIASASRDVMAVTGR